MPTLTLKLLGQSPHDRRTLCQVAPPSRDMASARGVRRLVSSSYASSRSPVGSAITWTCAAAGLNPSYSAAHVCISLLCLRVWVTLGLTGARGFGSHSEFKTGRGWGDRVGLACQLASNEPLRGLVLAVSASLAVPWRHAGRPVTGRSARCVKLQPALLRIFVAYLAAMVHVQSS